MKPKYILLYIIALIVLGLVIGIIRGHAPDVDEPVPTKPFHMPDIEFGPAPTSARPVRLPEAD